MIELPQYTTIFHDSGYETEEEIVNLKKLDEKELRMMGVSKRGQHFMNKFICSSYRIVSIIIFLIFVAHLRRFQNAIQNLKKPSGGKVTSTLKMSNFHFYVLSF